MLKKILILTLSFFFVFSLKVNAQTCDVTVNPGESIQQAINASPGNQTICVKQGTYKEVININKDGTKLISHPDNTQMPVIDGEYVRPGGSKAFPGCPGVYNGYNCYDNSGGVLVNISGDSVVLEGFEITRSKGRVIRVWRDGGTVLDTVVRNNYVYDNRDTGFVAYQSDNVLVEYNEFTGNSNVAPFPRPATVLDWGGTVASFGARNVTFQYNKVYQNWGEGILVDASTGGTQGVKVLGNRVADNYSTQMYIHAVEDVEFRDNFVYCTNDSKLKGYSGEGKPSNGWSIAGSEPQFNAIPTSNIIIKNNITAGCVGNFVIWGDRPDRPLTNIQVTNNTFYSSQYQNLNLISVPGALNNFSFEDNLVIGGSSKTDVSIGSNNDLYDSMDKAGLTPLNKLIIDTPVSAFLVPNYSGTGADVSLIPDVSEVGPQVGNTVIPTPDEPTPSPVYNPDFDVNKNGLVDIVDVIDLIKYLFQ